MKVVIQKLLNESKCNNAVISSQQNVLEFDGEKCMNAFMDKAAEMGYPEKLVEVSTSNDT